LFWVLGEVSADRLGPRPALGDLAVGARGQLLVQPCLGGVHVLGGVLPAHRIRSTLTSAPRSRRPCGSARSGPTGTAPIRTAAPARAGRTSAAASADSRSRRPAAGSSPASR